MKYDQSTESTSGMPAKDPSKVKWATQWFPIILRVWELENSTYLRECRWLSAYTVI